MRLFDMHCDTLYECYTKQQPLDNNTLQIDLQRGNRYTPWVQLLAVWMPDTIRGEAAYQQCCDILTFAKQEAARCPTLITLAATAQQIQTPTAGCTALLTVEGGSALAGQLGHVKDLAKQGVQAMTITWNGSNELGHGCLSGCDTGLTPFGKAAVCEMWKQGIVPDVSHLNEAGFWDVAALSEQPFIATHSVSRAVCDHPRNLTDRQFEEIRRRGGVVGINFCEDQLGEQTFDYVYRHIQHYLSLGGENTVAFGADLDGTVLPKEWDGIAVMEELYQYLLSKNMDEGLLDKIFFRNASNFFACALQARQDAVQ